MIEINLHLLESEDFFDSRTIYLPAVPRVGEYVYIDNITSHKVVAVSWDATNRSVTVDAE